MDKKRAWLKWTAITLAVLIIIFFAGQAILRSVVQKQIRGKLRSLSPEITVGVSSIETSLFSASVTFRDLSVLFSPGKKKEEAHFLYSPLVECSGIRIFKLLFSKKLIFNQVTVQNARIGLDPDLLKKDSLVKNIFNKISIPFAEIQLDHFSLRSCRIWLKPDTNSRALCNADLAVSRISLKPGADSGMNHIHAGSFECNLSQLVYPDAIDHHELKISSIRIDSKKDFWQIDSLRLIPLYGKLAFGKRVGHQADRVEAIIPKILISKPEIAELFNRKLIADKISLGKVNIAVFRDRSIPRKPVQQPLPVEYLKEIPAAIHAGSLELEQGNIAYEEFPKEGPPGGTLRIEKIHATLSPFINHPDKDHDHLNLALSCSLMGSGTVQADVYMPFDANKDYAVHGAIRELNLVSLNESAENLGEIHIESGILNSLQFDFTMSAEKSTGKIVGEYHDLVIDKLKRNDKNELKKAGFKSFALKHLIIPKNKDKSLPVGRRTGKVSFKRDPTRFVSHYLLHSLLTGIKSSFTLGFLLPG